MQVGIRMENQMRPLVGRRIHAVAARKSDTRRLKHVNRGGEVSHETTYCLTDLVVSNTLDSVGFAALGIFSCPSPLPVPIGVSEDSFQGQKYNAAIVKVVSRPFENVLVEQNHCHGLAIVMRSCRVLA